MGKAHDIAKKMTELEMQWFAMNLKIVDKNRKLVPFVMNPIQQKLAYCLNYQKAAGYPVRAYLLKARQVGSSTYIEGRCFIARCQSAKRTRTCSSTHRAVDKECIQYYQAV